MENRRRTHHVRVYYAITNLIVATAIPGCTMSPKVREPEPAHQVISAPLQTHNAGAEQLMDGATPPLDSTRVMPFEEAVLKAAQRLFSQASARKTEQPLRGKHIVVTDPIIDGIAGFESALTRSVESRITTLAESAESQFSVQPFSFRNVYLARLVLVGTLTPIKTRSQLMTADAYELCLALADLKSYKVIAKSVARADMNGFDHTPTHFFQDSPTWIRERLLETYTNTCRLKAVGDALDATYVNGMLAGAVITEAIRAYDNRQYRSALELYAKVLEMPHGKQLRVYNGLYLTNLKLGRKQAADQAFSRALEYGFANKKFAVKFPFKAGTAAFTQDHQFAPLYSSWVKEIARRAAQNGSCLEIIGHSSRTGSEQNNERLSQLRAEYIRNRLEAESPKLNGRAIASGAGSRENLIGTGKDDLTDALDRRIGFQLHSCG